MPAHSLHVAYSAACVCVCYAIYANYSPHRCRIAFIHAFRHLLLGSTYEVALAETLLGGGDTGMRHHDEFYTHSPSLRHERVHRRRSCGRREGRIDDTG